MGRTGAVRGDGVETEPLLTVDGWFDIGPLKQGKKNTQNSGILRRIPFKVRAIHAKIIY